MKEFILLTFLVIALKSNGQVISLQTGVSTSTFNWDHSPPGYIPQDEPISNSSVFVGVDYFNKKYFNLSSNVGYMSKSHNGLIYFPCGANSVCQATSRTVLNYLSINTTVDFKFPTRIGLSPFIAAGPRMDILRSNESNVFSHFHTLYKVNQIQYGCVLGFGIKYEVSNVLIGLRSDFLFNFNNTSELRSEIHNETYIFSERTQIFGLTLGYKLNQ